LFCISKSLDLRFDLRHWFPTIPISNFFKIQTLP
jgi:hypothetical protein